MQIQINTSNGVENKETLERWADGEIRQVLSRFVADVTRVEIHLSDENHNPSGAGDKRCTMEARLAGHQPLAVSHHASNLDEAFRGACDKLKRALDNTLGRLYGRRDRDSIRKDDGDAVVE
jgi:ribosome-associated translation inhibitor RaiA